MAEDRNALLTRLSELEETADSFEGTEWEKVYSDAAQEVRDQLYPGVAAEPEDYDVQKPAPPAPKKVAPNEPVDPIPGLERAALEARAKLEEITEAGKAIPKTNIPGQEPSAREQIQRADERAAFEAMTEAGRQLDEAKQLAEIAKRRDEAIDSRTRRTADERFMAKRAEIAAKLPAGWERDKFLAQHAAPDAEFVGRVREWVAELYDAEVQSEIEKRMYPPEIPKPKPQMAPDAIAWAEQQKGRTEAEMHAANRGAPR